MHVVGHYHDFFSLSQLRYILPRYVHNGMAYMALWMDLLLLLLLLSVYFSYSVVSSGR